jgi:nicotinate-nucleotide--dimethylbenzimidazole phosphoribosyltransferase
VDSVDESAAIPDFHEASAEAARARQRSLTKPPGSLGRIEELAVWYAGVRGRFPVAVPARGELVVFAADHGVAAEGVSQYPAAVTAAMVENFRAGGAAVCVLARQAGLGLTVVDVGVAGARFRADSDRPGTPPGAPTGAVPAGAGTGLPPHLATRFVDARIRPGSGNMVREPAMSAAEVEQAIAVGRLQARAAVARGSEFLIGGEMGIGNSTAAAALVSSLGGGPPEEVVGHGTGIDAPTWRHKVAVVASSLERHHSLIGTPASPRRALAAVGGLEIAALAGLMLEGARARVPTIVDGFIAGAAALVALRLAPTLRPFLLLSHLSAERGARRLAALLGSPAPLLELELRLGEGTGAVLAVPLLRAAVALQAEMATFEEAAVPDRA